MDLRLAAGVLSQTTIRAGRLTTVSKPGAGITISVTQGACPCSVSGLNPTPTTLDSNDSNSSRTRRQVS